MEAAASLPDLATSERSSLAACEATIERGLRTFVEVGHALLTIRDSRLYRVEHTTFEDYCRERWGMTPQHGGRLIAAAEVAVALEPNGSMPRTEAVARELAPLREEPEQMVEAWTEAVEQHGSQPTAAQVRDIVEPKRNAMAIHYSSQTDEWATPPDLFAAVAAEFIFDVDVCALSSSAKCRRYFTPEQDGLAQDWTGTCWMNPPYGQHIGHWVAKAHQAAEDGATVVCLVPARTDTAWWWDHCRHAEIRFLRGRLRFGDADTGAPFPSALVIFGRSATVKWWEWR